jgi:hippurate hydrolase
MILPRQTSSPTPRPISSARHVDRNRSLITAAEDFAYMLEACPGAFINIGNAGSVGSCPVHNPHYDFNDEALPIGASLLARLVEKKRSRLSGD